MRPTGCPKSEVAAGNGRSNEYLGVWGLKVSPRSAFVPSPFRSVSPRWAWRIALGVANLDENDEWVVGVRQERRYPCAAPAGSPDYGMFGQAAGCG